MENNLEKIFISLNETYPPILKGCVHKNLKFFKSGFYNIEFIF